MNPNVFLSIIIVSHNSIKFLENCLTSLSKDMKRGDYEVILVDNRSGDKSLSFVRKRFPEVKVISNSTNRGYSKAINQAVKISNSEYILALNADTIIRPEALETLLSFMESNPECGVAGPRLSYPDGKLQYSCRTFQTIRTTLFRRTILGRIFPESRVLKDHLMKDWDHNSNRAVDWLQGSALMIRRSALDQIGLMDERYFLYFEDVDLCYRMKNGGWKVNYVPQAEIIHYYNRGSYGKSLLNRDLLIHVMSMLRYQDKWNKMLYIFRKFLRISKTPILILFDSIGILCAFWFAFIMRDSIGFVSSKPLYPATTYYEPLFLFLIFSLSIYYFVGIYRNKRYQPWTDRLFLVSKGTLISCFTMMVLHFFSKGYQSALPYSRFILLFFVIFTILFVSFIHQSIYLGARILWRRGFNLKRTVVVGTDRIAVDIGKMLAEKLDLGYDFVGFITLSGGMENRANQQIIGGTKDLTQICFKERVQEVIFVNPKNHFESIVLPLVKLRKNLISTKIISDSFEAAVTDTRIKDFLGFPVLVSNFGAYYYVVLGLKRLVDIIFSAFFLIILSPLIFIIYFLLRLQKGKVLFIQKRVGKDEQGFNMYKFRSMVNDAEKAKKHLGNIISEGPLFKVKNDPRVTRIGRLLRKYNFDEIPQLINVLKGDMSIIGPRPPLPEEVLKYDNWHKARFEVKPGITGLWQVDKERKWKFDEMIRLDIYYILNWSPMLDLKILFRTPGAILRGRNLAG